MDNKSTEQELLELVQEYGDTCLNLHLFVCQKDAEGVEAGGIVA